MERQNKIDKTLTERHNVLRLLKSLSRENISLAEMDEIGVKLQKSGKRALPPLVRQLWREKSGDLISKYTYLLDFFDDETWIDQLIQIAIRRKDLEEEGKEALLGALEECGIDVSGPPFSLHPALDGSSLRSTLPKLLDKGEDGLVCFVEDILFMSPESRQELIRELPGVKDPRIVSLLDILLGIGDRGIRLEAAAALGRVRERGAAAVLLGLGKDPDDMVRKSAARSLRRLSFLGVDTPAPSPVPYSLPFHAAYVSPFDGTGSRTVWVSRHFEQDRLVVICLQLHETAGIHAAWGSRGITTDEFAGYLADSGPEEGLLKVAPEYALALVRDAIHRTGEIGAFLPAELYVWRPFAPGEIVPEPYEPAFAEHERNVHAPSSKLVAESGALLDDDFFAGWGIVKGRVCDYAEEWMELEKSAHGKDLTRGMEALVGKFCTELLVPDVERIKRRLVLTADLMRQTGRDRELLERTLAAAMSLDAPLFQRRHHPFFRRLALESMDLAREALAEGFDVRLNVLEDDGEWE